MKKIKLTQNKFALVDDEDFDKINKHRWYASKQPNSFYAARSFKGKTIRMHIEIMGHSAGKEIDHTDGDGLNNQRKNLRICTRSQNMMNRGADKKSVSGLKGVCWHKPYGKWLVKIGVNKKYIHLGYFFSKVEAHKAYRKASKKYHKEFSKIV